MADLSRIKVGQQVVLTIGADNSIECDYFGRVCVINKEKTRVQLKDVVFGPTKKALSGAKSFYSTDILVIKIISDVQDHSENERATETTLGDSIKFELTVKEKRTIQSRITNYCMIETVGEEFDKALEDIAHYYSVALTAVVGIGESGFVVCGTPHKIYVFNIKTIGAINGQFREWLESDTHTKVIHGANILEENLFHCHGISVKGVFDTKAVHKMFQSHIELPTELVEKMDSSKIDSLIGRTAILLKFHDFLTEHLLRNVYESFQLNLDYCRNKTSFEVQAIYRDGKSIVADIPSFQCIGLNVENLRYQE